MAKDTNSSKGYIKLHREIQNNPMWEDGPFSKGQAWVDLLLMANYKDNEFLLGNEIMNIERGQFFTSELKLSERWKWGRKKTRLFLKLLKTAKMATTEGTTKGTTVTIVNYSFYQDEGTTEDTAEGTSKEQRRNNGGTQTIKSNKEKKEKEDIYSGIDEELIQPLKDFVSMRKETKSPISIHGIELMIKELNKLSNGDNKTAIKILEQSIMRSWKGIFQLKEDVKVGEIKTW